jgi:DNA repair protein RadC
MDVKLRKDDRIRVLNGIDLYEVMVRILKRSSKIDQKKEHFWVVGLDQTQEILFIELLQLGGKTTNDIKPTHVFGYALKKDASMVVLVHNEPTGNVTPSNDIKELTGKMVNVGEFLDVEVWDHLIISEKTYFSYLQSELLAVVGASVSVPVSMREMNMRKELDEREAVISLSKSVLKLKELGMSAEKIATIIDLPLWEIKNIIDMFENGESTSLEDE